jgi:hypothetical protein
LRKIDVNLPRDAGGGRNHKSPQIFGNATEADFPLTGYDADRAIQALKQFMSPDLFFHPRADFAAPFSAAPCDTCPQAKAGAFCGARILPECLRIGADGSVRVSLSASAQTWFEMLARLGEVLQLSRNPVGVLGRLGTMPELCDGHNGPLPRSRDGLFTPNLAEYANLWAVREMSPLGAMHGFEVWDVAGHSFERIWLSHGANRELFEQFVIQYQSPPAAGNWFPPNHAGSARRRQRLAGRIPWLRAELANASPHVRRLPPKFLAKALVAAAKANFPVRLTQYHPALIRTLIWTPQIPEEMKRRRPPDFFHGDDAGLHLHFRGVASAWLWTGQCGCCAEQRWSIELADARDHIGFALLAGDEAGETAWRELIQSCLP